MNSFPFYRNYYNPNYHYMLNKHNQSNPNMSNYYNYENSFNQKKEIDLNQNRRKREQSRSQKKEPLFELFGFQLFLDDLIILGLLFFLYNEGVNDEFLYIILILLLLS